MKLLLGLKMNSLVSVGLKVCVKENTPLWPGARERDWREREIQIARETP